MADRVIIFDIRRANEQIKARDVQQMCVGLNTRILVSDREGVYKKASDVLIGDVVCGVDSDGYISTGKIEKIFNRTSNAKRISFYNGSSLVLSNHPLQTWDGSWISSDEVSVNDKIRVIKKSSDSINKESHPRKGDCFYTRVKSIENLNETKLINFQVNPIETFICEDIVTHNCGRAGRMHGQEEADVHLIMNSGDVIRWKKILENASSYEIRSTLNDLQTFSFHIISQIVRGKVRDSNTFHDWYDLTLDKFQREKRGEEIPNFEDIAKDLHKNGVAKYDEETGIIQSKPLGKICAAFYFSPYDIHDWFVNINELYRRDLLWNDYCQAWAFSNIRSSKDFANKKVIELSSNIIDQVQSKRLTVWGGTESRLLAYDYLLRGRRPKCDLPIFFSIKHDISRVLMAIESICNVSKRLWGDQTEFIETLKARSTYGVPTNLAKLVRIKGIGKTTASILFDDFNITSEKQLLEKADLIRTNGAPSTKRALTKYLKDKKNEGEVEKLGVSYRAHRRISKGKDEYGDE